SQVARRAPFGLRCDGFVLGEGAGVLILEELEHARRRGAPICAEIARYGTTADAYPVTASHPQGRRAAACIEAALKDADLGTEDIGYINAHGTSTPLNDKVETPYRLRKVAVFRGQLGSESVLESVSGSLVVRNSVRRILGALETSRAGGAAEQGSR